MISGKGNKPVVFQNFAYRLIQTVTELKALKDIFRKFDSIKVDADECFANVLKQIDSAEWETGGARAEFRLRLCDALSLMKLIDSLFSVEKILEWTFAFKTSIITRLAKFYVHALNKPFMDNFIVILQRFESSIINQHEILERISTISMIESLLTATLFSGLTYCYASELVWNKSNNERHSLELLQVMKTHNRLVLKESFFAEGCFKLFAPSQLLDFIFNKINRNKIFIFPPVELIINFNLSQKQQEKADLLFMIYFSELNPNAFRSSNLPRWKTSAVNNQTITFMEDLISFRGAVSAIFNFSKLTNPLTKAWKNRYYLRLADDWMKQRGGPSKEVLENLLLNSIRNLGIEHIHYAGNSEYNGNPSKHVKINWAINQNHNSTSVTSKYLSERDTMLLARSGMETPKLWLDYDILVLVDGVNKYKFTGRNMFKNIFEDPTLNFKFRREVPKLKSKWKNLVDTGAVREDCDQWVYTRLTTTYRTNNNYLDGIHLPPSPASSPLRPTHFTPVVQRQLNLTNPPAYNSFSNFSNSGSENSNNDFDTRELNDFPDHFEAPTEVQNETVSSSTDTEQEHLHQLPSSDYNSVFDGFIGKIFFLII